MIYENEDREDEECGCNTFDGLGCNVLYTIGEVGAIATVRGSMDQVAMTGYVGRAITMFGRGFHQEDDRL